MSSNRSTLMRLSQSRWMTKCLFATMVLVSLVVATSNTHSQQAAPDYKNPRLPVDQRVADLLSRMTLEEKAAQVMKYGMGQIARQRERKDARQGAIFANAVQKWLLENTRLGIPAIL